MKLSKRRKMESIPLSAMGDIAFLLLVFFMATTMVTDQRPLEFDLPEQKASVKASPYPLLVYASKALAEEDKVFFYNKVIPITDLSAMLKEQAAIAPAAVRFYLNVERDLPFRMMQRTLDEFKKAGIRNVVISTIPPKGNR
jgi:biopolymer transport protein ExbD